MVTSATIDLVADRLAVGLQAVFRHRYYVTNRAHFRVTWTEEQNEVRFTFRVEAPNVYVAGDPTPSVTRDTILITRTDIARLAHGITVLDAEVTRELHDLLTEVADAITQKLLVRAFCSPTP